VTAAVDKQSFAAQALALSRKMLNGADTNGNGVIEPLLKEGGTYTTYFYSQYLAALGAQPEPGSGVSTPVPVTATATEVAPAATATPGPPGVATATAPAPTKAPAPTPKPVFITYSNFVINPPQTTIKVGTTVVFIIQKGPHEPYNATGSDQFDSGTGLVDTTYSFTFRQAGTITILCGYHNNMTATLVIQP
jgi:plastocyanin